jgi:hypothetical protein
MKYIIITEDNEVYKCENISDEDLKSCDLGIMDIIRVSDLKKYFDGEWHELSTYD